MKRILLNIFMAVPLVLFVIGVIVGIILFTIHAPFLILFLISIVVFGIWGGYALYYFDIGRHKK